MVVTIYNKIHNEYDLTKKRERKKTKQMACTCLNRTCRLHNGSTYIVTKVSKLLRWLSDLINLSRRLAIWPLGRTKLNCSQRNSIICILLVLKSFIRNRFATKSREFSWNLFRFSTSEPYSSIGIHLYFTRCSTTSSEAVRPNYVFSINYRTFYDSRKLTESRFWPTAYFSE